MLSSCSLGLSRSSMWEQIFPASGDGNLEFWGNFASRFMGSEQGLFHISQQWGTEEMSIWVINRRNVNELGGWASGLGLRSCANPDWSSGPLEVSVKSKRVKKRVISDLTETSSGPLDQSGFAQLLNPNPEAQPPSSSTLRLFITQMLISSVPHCCEMWKRPCSNPINLLAKFPQNSKFPSPEAGKSVPTLKSVKGLMSSLIAY